MSDFLLTQIINYGAPTLGAIVFFGAMGIPFPGTFIVIAVGALCRQGFLPWHTTGLIALTCVVLGDCLSYGMGYYARELVLRRFGNSDNWRKAQDFFHRWGGMSVFFSRFLVTGIAVPVNLISGSGGLTFRRFLMYDLIGETIWIFGYGGLGYLFGSQWEAIGEFLSNMSGFLLGLIILAIGVWLAVTLFGRKGEANSKRHVPDV